MRYATTSTQISCSISLFATISTRNFRMNDSVLRNQGKTSNQSKCSSALMADGNFQYFPVCKCVLSLFFFLFLKKWSRHISWNVLSQYCRGYIQYRSVITQRMRDSLLYNRVPPAVQNNVSALALLWVLFTTLSSRKWTRKKIQMVTQYQIKHTGWAFEIYAFGFFYPSQMRQQRFAAPRCKWSPLTLRGHRCRSPGDPWVLPQPTGMQGKPGGGLKSGSSNLHLH